MIKCKQNFEKLKRSFTDEFIIIIIYFLTYYVNIMFHYLLEKAVEGQI